ncbi:MAG: CoA pyrophosphatase [Pseudomonadota bacterium]
MTFHRQTLDRLSRALTAAPARSSDFDLSAAGGGAVPLRPAAVLVPLIDRPQGLSVLLTRRSPTLRHHPGQIAFPGGKQDAGDRDLWATALREADEEVGLDPTSVAPMGRLDRHETVTRFDVEPHVGLIPADAPLRIDRREVAEAFEVPLEAVLDAGRYQVHSRLWQGRERRYYAVPYGPYYIWGATARILKGLADRVARV